MMEQSESPSSRSSLIEENVDIGNNPTTKVERDYYAVLEVPSNATGEHIGGSFNRIYNRIIALQHNGPQTEDTAASFKELTEAYEVLSDPVKRRAYDKRHQPASISQQESIVGRAFGAIISRFAAPVTSTTSATASTSGLAADILDTVGILCQQGGIEGKGPPMDPRVAEISWGVGIEGRVDRQAACYYRLSVTADDVDNGFIIHCKSAAKDKFKLVMFESSGRLLHKEECSRSGVRMSTEATLFFVSFDVPSSNGIVFQPTSPLFPSDSDQNQGSAHGSDSAGTSPHVLKKERDGPLTAVSDRIDQLTGPTRSAVAGQYLLCVYGDNILSKSTFTLTAVMARNEAPEVATIKDSDDRLCELKRSLRESEAEFAKCRAAFELSRRQLKKLEDSALEVVDTRDKAYRGLVDASIEAYKSETTPVSTPVTLGVEPVSPTPSSLLGGLGSSIGLGAPAKKSVVEGEQEEVKPAARVAVAAAAASSAASSAATTASAAGGWLAKRISEGVTQLQQGAKSTQTQTSAAKSKTPPNGPAWSIQLPSEGGVEGPPEGEGEGDARSQGQGPMQGQGESEGDQRVEAPGGTGDGFERFESLDIVHADGGDEDMVSDPVVIQPHTR